MHTPYWPVADVAVHTPRLTLKSPDGHELAALAALAHAGVHGPERMPFPNSWTDAPPLVRAQRILQYHWASWAIWKPEDWRLSLVVVHDGVVVGQQVIFARAFARAREFETSSWLGLAHHGRGIGREMRRAVLHLGFEGLGAQEAVSSSFHDNLPPRRISESLGYRPDGRSRQPTGTEVRRIDRYRLERADWQCHRPEPAEITGLADALPYFGLAVAAAADAQAEPVAAGAATDPAAPSVPAGGR
jgi:RimJ/RimL family protein N-acetyltransferase